MGDLIPGRVFGPLPLSLSRFEGLGVNVDGFAVCLIISVGSEYIKGVSLSSEYVERLRERARAFLSEAMSAENPDLAVFFAEQSMQLYVKAILYEIFGERVRGHRLRELLAVLVKGLEGEGFRDLAGEVLDFIDRKRRLFIVAEEAYTMSRYGDVSYSKDDAEGVIELASELIKLLDEVSTRVKLG